jgi:hypothetical protein
MTDQQAKRVIVVLSPGRSGTSLLMKSLETMGMKLSENMIPGRHENPEGFFEDEEIVKLHKQMFKGLFTKASLPLPDNWLSMSEAKKGRQALAQKLQKEVQKHEGFIWGFKDPRTSSFLPLWNNIFNLERTTPIFLVAARDPATVVFSQQRYYNIQPEVVELQWLQRTTDALHHTAADCFIVHYEDWFTRPVEQAKGLLRYTGLDQYFSGNIEEALKNVIKPNLNRAVYEEYQVQNEYTLKLYDVLKDCRGEEFDRQRVMSIVKECRKAMYGFKGWYIEAQNCVKNLTHLKDLESFKKKTSEFEELKKLYQRNEKHLVEMEKDLHQITIQNNAYLKQIKDLHDEKEELRVRLSSRQSDIISVNVQKLQQREELQKERAEKLRNEVSQLKIKLKMLRKSKTFQAGLAIREAINQPLTKGPLLPWRLIKLFREKVRKSQY